jgi:hypothetical protein
MSLSFDVAAKGDHGPTIWEYIAPAEPAKDGSFWVIPASAPDNYDIIWQRRDDLIQAYPLARWVRAARPGTFRWDEIPGRERGYLLEVPRG